jgi:signal transduction histidine kinase
MGATLAATKMSVAWLASKLPAGMPQLASEVDHLAGLVSTGIQTMRQTVAQLNPGRLGEVGLMATIGDYVQKFQQYTKIECALLLPNEEMTLGDDQSTTIFRIIQESLNNVMKHAQASEVHITLKKRGKSLLLTIEDNGIGLNPDEHKKQSFGLLGIRERALMVGGKVRIKSQPGKGTRISASIPLAAGNNPPDAA